MAARRKGLLALAGAMAALPALALDKDAKQWLDEVKPLMLAEEEKTFTGLKDKGDRAEFQKIFWARRDPDLETPANEFQAEYMQLKAAADAAYPQGKKPGSHTDCGRLHILLGAPDNVAKAGDKQTWTYVDKPARPVRGGKLEMSFDGSCMLPANGPVDINRVAESRVQHPNIGYKTGGDGKITKLVDQLPKPSPTQTLVRAPRTDFPLTAEPKMIVRGTQGATYVGGVARGESTGLSVDGAKRLLVTVVAEAVDEVGKATATREQQRVVEVAPDGSFIVSYGLTLKPGKYNVKIAVLDPKANKGSVAQHTVEAPDLAGAELAIADLLVITAMQEGVTVDPKDALADFYLGTNKVVPRFGNVFSLNDQIEVVGFVYNAAIDPATGKASTTSCIALHRDGKPITTCVDQPSDQVVSGPSVGPIAASALKAGKFTAKLKVKDNVAGKEYTKETSFEVK